MDVVLAAIGDALGASVCSPMTTTGRHKPTPKYDRRSPQSGASSRLGDCHESIGMENDLTLVVDALPGLVWTTLADGRIDFFNQRWYQYTGLGVDEAFGAGWQAAIHPEDLPKLLECWRSPLASDEPCDMEVRL